MDQITSQGKKIQILFIKSGKKFQFINLHIGLSYLKLKKSFKLVKASMC